MASEQLIQSSSSDDSDYENDSTHRQSRPTKWYIDCCLSGLLTYYI